MNNAVNVCVIRWSATVQFDMLHYSKIIAPTTKTSPH